MSISPVQPRFLSLADLSNMPAPAWLIDGLFERGSLVMLAGPPASFKSFLLLSWLMCMASGRPWLGRTTATCKVAYVLGEGKASLIRRAQAWIQHSNLTPGEQASLDANFKVCFNVPQLALKSSTDNFLADLASEGFKPDVIAIDTFARSFVGLDENDAKDTGTWIESADRLRQLGHAVILLHHTKKSTEFGVAYRGSTAIMGAMDTAFTMTRSDNTCTVKVSKQKDHDEGPDLKFRKVDINVGGNEKSCVLVPMMMIDTEFEAKEVGDGETDYTADVGKIVKELMGDTSFKSDRARARALALKTGRSEAAAQSLISKRRKSESGGE